MPVIHAPRSAAPWDPPPVGIATAAVAAPSTGVPPGNRALIFRGRPGRDQMGSAGRIGEDLPACADVSVSRRWKERRLVQQGAGASQFSSQAAGGGGMHAAGQLHFSRYDDDDPSEEEDDG